MADQPIDQLTEPTTRSLSLSAFMQEQPKGSIPYKVKQFQRLAMKYAEPDPTKALVEIEIVVPEGQSLASLLESIEDFEVEDLSGEELDADDVARIDAACAEYDALPVEVHAVLDKMVVKAFTTPSHTKPGPGTHSAKWDRCVEHVNAKGGGYNAYAVCTAALGEGSFRSVGSVALSAMAQALQGMKYGTEDQYLLDEIAASGGRGVSEDGLMSKFNLSSTEAINILNRLIARGRIRQIREGVYAVTTGKALQVKLYADLASRSSMSLKALPDGWVEGCAVLFTDPSRKDLTGDYFTSHTELAWEGKESRIAMYHHGMDPTFKDEELHQGWRLDRIDDVGVWVKHQLDMRDEYEAAIYGMVKAAKLGLSSGAASHLVKRADDGQLLRWPISEISYTPTPAEPGTSVTAIKALGQVQTFEELSGKSAKKAKVMMPKLPTSKPVEVVPVPSRLDRALALTTIKPQDVARVKAALKFLNIT